MHLTDFVNNIIHKGLYIINVFLTGEPFIKQLPDMNGGYV